MRRSHHREEWKNLKRTEELMSKIQKARAFDYVAEIFSYKSWGKRFRACARIRAYIRHNSRCIACSAPVRQS